MFTQELTTTSILALFETDKAQRQSFANQVICEIEEGNVNPLEIHLQIKAMEDIITQLTSTDEKKNKNVEAAKKYREYLLQEAQKNGRDFEFHSAKFKVSEVGTKYDYSNCNDAILANLKLQQEQLNEKVKEREKFLQNLPEGGHNVVDEDSGEMITLYRPAKSSTTAVSVTLK